MKEAVACVADTLFSGPGTKAFGMKYLPKDSRDQV